MPSACGCRPVSCRWWCRDASPRWFLPAYCERSSWLGSLSISDLWAWRPLDSGSRELLVATPVCQDEAGEGSAQSSGRVQGQPPPRR